MANLYIIIYIDNSNVVFMYDKVANRDFPTYYYGFIHCRIVGFFYLCTRKQLKHIHYETNLYFPYNVHVGINAGNDDKL